MSCGYRLIGATVGAVRSAKSATSSINQKKQPPLVGVGRICGPGLQAPSRRQGKAPFQNLKCQRQACN